MIMMMSLAAVIIYIIYNIIVNYYYITKDKTATYYKTVLNGLHHPIPSGNNTQCKYMLLFILIYY